MTLIGIDLGMNKVATAIFTEGDQGLRLYLADAFTAGEDMVRSDRLWELARYVHDQALFFEADQVYCEGVIIGNNRKYSLGLAETKGAIIAKLAELRARAPLDIRTVDNKVWKKELLGSGNASKEQVRNYIVDTHPDYAPLCGDDQDRYDAVAIGLYGLRIVARARELHLVQDTEPPG